MIGSVGDDVVHAVKRVLDEQGAHHARCGSEVRAIDARAALCVC